MISRHPEETSAELELRAEVADLRQRLEELQSTQKQARVPGHTRPAAARKKPSTTVLLSLFIIILVLALLTFLLLLLAEPIERALGDQGLMVLTRIFGLLLLAIAVSTIMSAIASAFPGLS